MTASSGTSEPSSASRWTCPRSSWGYPLLLLPPPQKLPMAELSIAEKSARAVALGQYARFLLKRYQRLELIEIGETDPVSLRQIFVPMRVGSEDLREEEVGKGVSRVQDEKLPGED